MISTSPSNQSNAAIYNSPLLHFAPLYISIHAYLDINTKPCNTKHGVFRRNFTMAEPPECRDGGDSAFVNERYKFRLCRNSKTRLTSDACEI